MNIPIEALQNVVMDQSSDKALRAVTSLSESIELLNNAIMRRSELIEGFKADGYSVETMYFDLPVNGNTNKEYGSSINGIFLYDNDVIFFSLKLCEYLCEHALKAVSKYKKISGNKVGVCELDISAATDEGLLPDEPAHKKWKKSFIEDSNATEVNRKWYSFIWSR